MAAHKPRSKAGFVYILTNESMPGIVKIGMTSRNPEVRLREINSATGVLPFELEAVIASRNAKWTERAVHERLAGRRVTENREFFRIAPASARRVVFEVARRQRQQAFRGQTWKQRISLPSAVLLSISLVPLAALMNPVLAAGWLILCLCAVASGRPRFIHEYLGMTLRPGVAALVAALGSASAYLAHAALPAAFPISGWPLTLSGLAGLASGI
jgi:hypothetical protein